MHFSSTTKIYGDELYDNNFNNNVERINENTFLLESNSGQIHVHVHVERSLNQVHVVQVLL